MHSPFLPVHVIHMSVSMSLMIIDIQPELNKSNTSAKGYDGELSLYFLVFIFFWSIGTPKLQQSDVSVLFQIFSCGLLQNIEQHFLCYTIGSWLIILNIAVCSCQSQTPPIYPSLPSCPITISSFSMCVSLFIL